MFVVDGAPEPRHPTLAGAASTGPPVPTGAATAVVAVHGLGGGLDRVRCRGTLALQDISIVTVVPKLQASPSINRTEKNTLRGNSHLVHFDRVRTTCGDVLARSDSGIKLNKRLIRIFVLNVLFLEVRRGVEGISAHGHNHRCTCIHIAPPRRYG